MFAACGGDGSGEVAAVFPDSGFIGRQVQVEVTGDGTSFDTSSTVNFGEGVTVNAINVIADGGLIVDLTINATAAAGKRDVTVTVGGDTLTLPEAFDLQPPIAIEALLPLAQGGLGLFSITNLDLLHPFDPTTDMNTGDFIGVQVTAAGTGTTVSVANVTGSEIVFQASADVDATGGALTVTSTAAGGATLTSPAGNLDVLARTAVVLTEGTPAVGTLDNSALYEITLTKDELLHLDVATANPDADLRFTLLPASGKWADAGGAETATDALVAPGQKFYLALTDFQLVTGYSYTLTAATLVDLTGIAATAEVEQNATSATATAGTGATIHFTGALADETDVDFYKVTVASGKKIHVRTTTGAAGLADTQISIFNPNGTTFTKDATDTDIDGVDNGFGEDVLTAVLTPGTYFIKIEPSAFAVGFFGYTPANDAYDTIVTIE